MTSFTKDIQRFHRFLVEKKLLNKYMLNMYNITNYGTREMQPYEDIYYDTYKKVNGNLIKYLDGIHEFYYTASSHTVLQSSFLWRYSFEGFNFWRGVNDEYRKAMEVVIKI